MLSVLSVSKRLSTDCKCPVHRAFVSLTVLNTFFCYLSLQIIYKYAKSLTALAAPSLVVVVSDEHADTSEG